MTEETAPTFEITHKRVITLTMKQAEIEALIIAEAIRRAALRGIVADLNKGVGTKASVNWWELNVVVEIAEDIPPAGVAP